MNEQFKSVNSKGDPITVAAYVQRVLYFISVMFEEHQSVSTGRPVDCLF